MGWGGGEIMLKYTLKYSHGAYGRHCWWHWLRITAAIETDRQRDTTVGGICGPHKHTHSRAHTTNTQSYLHYQYRPCSVQDTELKGHSVLLLSPVKCHQATLVSSRPSASHVTSFWTISYSLAAEVHQNIKQPTDRGEQFWDNAAASILSYATQWEQGRIWCNWDLLLSRCVYWIWRLDITQEALLFESSCFIFGANGSHFGCERKYKLAEWGDCGVICQNVLMIILAQLVLNTVEKEHIYLLCIFGVICGKEKISVWEMAFGYSAHHQQPLMELSRPI